MKPARLTPNDEEAEKAARTMRNLIRRYGSTAEAAEALNVSEAWIWNRLPADAREVKK